ncbi:MAG: hypothetical protein ACOYL6_07735 [Bacteriovoracaceae bacterium]
MKILSTSLLLLISYNSFANCHIFIPKKEFLHDSGYSIMFDFNLVIGPKNYIEVYSQDEASYRLELEGIERVTPTFHFAVGILRLVKANGELVFKTQEQNRCLTQYCAISDYGKSFKKAYKGFLSGIPNCR